jgi:Uma2 family endonuclease
MSTRSADFRQAVDHLPAGGTLVVQDVSWEAYEQLLDELADRPGVRVTYDEGKLQIMSPLPEHEKYKRFIERMIDVAGEELDLDLEPLGSATWKRSRDTKGAEPDSCYYVAHSAQIRGKRTIDLDVDPPPDLVIEIDATNESVDKFPIYSTFGVPEVWRYDVKRHRVHFYELRGSAYVDIASSRSFPILTPEVLADFIDHSKTRGQQAALAGFRDWVRAESRVR